jgi:hypothetical protein
MYSGGKGLLVTSPKGKVALISNDDGSTVIMSGAKVNQLFTTDEGGAATAGDLIDRLQLAPSGVGPDEAIDVAGDIMLGARWRGSKGELVHDPETRVTYIVDALANPEKFLADIHNQETEVIDTTLEDRSVMGVDPVTLTEDTSTTVVVDGDTNEDSAP